MTPAPLPIPKTANILVVDDEKDIRETLCQGILLSGYDCSSAENGECALEHLKRHNVDVVISDINMPGMDGIELLRTVKSRFDASVIIMTGYVNDFTYEEIVGLGASDFVQKPVRFKEIVARLQRVLLERHTLKDRNKAMEALQMNLDKFQRAMVGTIKAISMAIELRDPYTAGHQQRVAELACAIGRELTLGEDTIYGLRMASVLHDLGKIAVPSEILTRPGQLNDLEYGIIKSHVQTGYDILKKIEFPWPLADIVMQHHERLDGSGYPNGLNGDEIMFEAKILAVADVFETIASHRPYRPSLGVNHAMEELATNKGILYDKDVVAACILLMEEKRFEFEPASFRPASRKSTAQHYFNA
jgi:putative two-component system response regulator